MFSHDAFVFQSSSPYKTMTEIVEVKNKNFTKGTSFVTSNFYQLLE